MKTVSTRSLREERTQDMRHDSSIPFNRISEPGTYYSQATGWLYRLPEKSLEDGQNPKMSIVGNSELRLTKISDDPEISLDKARKVCADREFDVNF